MAELEVLLQHGWALDSTMWSRWIEVARQSDPTINIKVAERGYFCAPSFQPTFSDNDSLKILIVHSLGLHLASKPLFEKADLLVVIGGFANFHDGTERESRLSQIAVRKMLQKLDREPVQVVQDFYINCGFPVDFGSEKSAQLKNLQLIKSDLELLHRSTINANWLSLPSEILLLHGELDTIAPAYHALRLRELCRRGAVEVHNQGTHALPYDQPSWCVNQIQKCLLVARQ
ncbi:MAG: alpha/beta hydrolase [Cyanobacteria bacterium SZAS-4]|nr:alpha/beta hydrolase [Cyanobacteria bacterium SZAS-4]